MTSDFNDFHVQILSLCLNELEKYCEEQKNEIIQVAELKIQKLQENSQIDQMNRSKEELIEIIEQFQQKCIESDLIKQTILKTLDNSFRRFDHLFISDKELDVLKNLIFNNKKIVFNKSLDDFLIGSIDFDECFTKILTTSAENSTIFYKNITLLDIDADSSNESSQTFNGEDLIYMVKKAPDNLIIQSNWNGKIKIINMLTGECIQIIDAHTNLVTNIIILSDNSFATSSNDRTIKIFDLHTFECIQTFIGHENEVTAIDKISNDELVSCSSESIRVWNVQNGQCVNLICDESIKKCLKVISDELVACGSNENIDIWNFKTNELLRTIEGHSTPVTCIIQISKEQIASGDELGFIQIWDLNNGYYLKKIYAHDGKCSLIKLSKNSIVSNGFDDKKIKIWNTETGECLKTFDGYINIDLI